MKLLTSRTTLGIADIAVSPCGQKVCVVYNCGRPASLHCADTLCLLATVGGSGPTSAHGAAFSPDGRRVATADRDGCVRLWDVAESERLAGGKALEREFLLAGRCTHLSFLPDGRLLVNPGMRAGLLDTATGEVRWLARCESCCASADGRRVVTADTGGLWRVFSVSPEIREDGTWRVSGRRASECGPLLSPDGRFALAVRQTSVSAYDAGTGKRSYRLGVRCGRPGVAAFSPCGELFALGGFARLQVRRTASGALLRSYHGTSRLNRVEFTPSGHRLVAAWTGNLELWDTGRLKPPASPPLARGMAAAALAGDAVAAVALADWLEESGGRLAAVQAARLRAGDLGPAAYHAT